MFVFIIRPLVKDVSLLTLYQFPGPWDVCSASCFCAKVEAFLRWQKIPYRAVSALKLKGSPKGKVPYIEDENGKLGDSEAIIRYLTDKHGLTHEEGLSAEQKAMARAIRYVCDEGIYRATSYFRFMTDEGWEVAKTYFLAPFPAWAKPIAAWKIRGYAKKQQWMHGIGRHTPDEVAQMVQADIDALSALLGDKPFFFGERMHVADIIVFSVMSGLVSQPFDNAANRAGRGAANLVSHYQRV
ncbi:MAG: glutathione S-transferase N-terminal domain-containing protein, partial [Rickettsiales bacterium]|nr:glutathione S-transferase N-terminal domain-containing protein [Rickettsiales bacterium]